MEEEWIFAGGCGLVKSGECCKSPPRVVPPLVGRECDRRRARWALAVLPERVHVEVAPPADPLLALLRRQRRHQPFDGRAVGKDPHHPCAALEFLVGPRGYPAPARSWCGRAIGGPRGRRSRPSSPRSPRRAWPRPGDGLPATH